MAKVELKQPIVDEIKEMLDGAQSAVAVKYLGITVEQDTKLRKELRENGVSYKVYKNTLIKRAAEGTDFEAQKPNGRAWACVHASDTLYAGFPHLYFRANPAFAARFVRRCAQKG